MNVSKKISVEVLTFLEFYSSFSFLTEKPRVFFVFFISPNFLVGLLEICRLLIQSKADHQARTVAGWTPLNWAIRNDHPDLIAYLQSIPLKN